MPEEREIWKSKTDPFSVWIRRDGRTADLVYGVEGGGMVVQPIRIETADALCLDLHMERDKEAEAERFDDKCICTHDRILHSPKCHKASCSCERFR